MGVKKQVTALPGRRLRGWEDEGYGLRMGRRILLCSDCSFGPVIPSNWYIPSAALLLSGEESAPM